MRLTKLNSNAEVYVNLDKYRIDWDRKVSGPQLKVQKFLELFWENDYVLSEAYIPGSKKRLDIWNVTKSIIVEVSPKKVHGEYNAFFHKSRSGYLKSLKSDNAKVIWAERNNQEIITLDDNDIKNLSKLLFLDKFGVVL